MSAEGPAEGEDIRSYLWRIVRIGMAETTGEDKDGRLVAKKVDLRSANAALKQLAAMAPVGGANEDSTRGRADFLNSVVKDPLASREQKMKAIEYLSRLNGDLVGENDLTITHKNIPDMTKAELKRIIMGAADDHGEKDSTH